MIRAPKTWRLAHPEGEGYLHWSPARVLRLFPSSGKGREESHFPSNNGLAISPWFADSGCSAFQRMAAVMRVRPLG